MAAGVGRRPRTVGGKNRRARSNHTDRAGGSNGPRGWRAAMTPESRIPTDTTAHSRRLCQLEENGTGAESNRSRRPDLGPPPESRLSRPRVPASLTESPPHPSLPRTLSHTSISLTLPPHTPFPPLTHQHLSPPQASLTHPPRLDRRVGPLSLTRTLMPKRVPGSYPMLSG